MTTTTFFCLFRCLNLNGACSVFFDRCFWFVHLDLSLFLFFGGALKSSRYRDNLISTMRRTLCRLPSRGGGILAVLGNTTWTFHRRYEQISVGVIAHVDVQTMDARLLTGGLSLMEH